MRSSDRSRKQRLEDFAEQDAYVNDALRFHNGHFDTVTEESDVEADNERLRQLFKKRKGTSVKSK